MMKKAAVFGLGKSGISSCTFLLKEGYQVFACDDKKSELPTGVHFLTKEHLHEMDFLVISPGVPLTHPFVMSATIEVFCDIELAFRYRVKPICGITGSNGKTTTTLLTSHFLTASNIPNKTVGNIGNPLLDQVESDEHLVCELSSFQLETTVTPVLDAACILNITPNHLDRHITLDAYANAKENIGRCIKKEGQFWVQEEVSRTFTLKRNHFRFGFSSSSDLYSDGKYVVRFGKKEATLPEILQDIQSHDVENFLAAFALARSYGADPNMIAESYESFKKPKHRIEFVREHNQIRYFDDSKATSIEAVISAVKSLKKFPGKIILIAGGVHKGHPYHAWKEAFESKVRALVLIGQAASQIEQDLDRKFPIYHAETLDDAVRIATNQAFAGDTVLLSPGCASFDMFKSFEDRGERFQELVKSL